MTGWGGGGGVWGGEGRYHLNTGCMAFHIQVCFHYVMLHVVFAHLGGWQCHWPPGRIQHHARKLSAIPYSWLQDSCVVQTLQSHNQSGLQKLCCAHVNMLPTRAD